MNKVLFVKGINYSQKVFLSLFVFLFFFITSVSALNFAGGDGTSGNPYQITNWTALNEVRNSLTSYYVLNANLSSATSDYTGIGNSWIPISNATTNFAGTFDGKNNTIGNLIITNATPQYASLFGYSSYANISNLGLPNINITAFFSSGAILGYQAGGTINNCWATGNVTQGVNVMGGLVGRQGAGNGIISNCYFIGNVTGGTNTIGGIVGMQDGGASVINCYSNGMIRSSGAAGDYVGGVVGRQAANGNILNVLFNGHASGRTYVGGIVGYSNGNITNATNEIGNVTSTGQYAGGITGFKQNGFINKSHNHATINNNNQIYGAGIAASVTTAIIQYCYNTGDVYGGSNGGNNGGLIGKLNSGSLLDSWSNGTINGRGGLVGWQSGGVVNRTYFTGRVNGVALIAGGVLGYRTSGSLSDSYAAGFVSNASQTQGGLVAMAFTGLPNSINSYWDINVTQQPLSPYGSGYYTPQMKNISSFSNWSIQLTNISYNNGYPFFGWEVGNDTATWLIWDGIIPPTPTIDQTHSKPITPYNSNVYRKSPYIRDNLFSNVNRYLKDVIGIN
jgi:hypothetical protein